MSFRDELNETYNNNSTKGKRFNELLIELKAEMKRVANGGDACIKITETHSLSEILNYPNMLSQWCKSEDLEYQGYKNAFRYVCIDVSWD